MIMKVRNLKLNSNTNNEGKQLQSNYICYMKVKVEWEKEEDMHCVCLGGKGELGEGSYFQGREREKLHEKIKNVYLNICRTEWPCGLRRRSGPLACWDCGFESCLWHGCLPLVGVVSCQVEVAATG